jgi:hypothetical protein
MQCFDSPALSSRNTGGGAAGGGGASDGDGDGDGAAGNGTAAVGYQFPPRPANTSTTYMGFRVRDHHWAYSAWYVVDIMYIRMR